MARKPEAGGGKGAAAPAEGKTQGERFIETARAAGVDETGEEFERAFAKIVHPATGPSPAGEQPKRPSGIRSKGPA